MPDVRKILVFASISLLVGCQTDARRCETKSDDLAYRMTDHCVRAATPTEGSDRPERQVRHKPVKPTEPEGPLQPTEPEPEGPLQP